MNDGPPNFTRRAATAGLLAMTLPLDGQLWAAGASAWQGPLRFSGAKMAVEMAPVHLALEHLYGEKALFVNGGVVNLVGADAKADIASNGETQNLRAFAQDPGIRVLMTIAQGHYPIIARRAAGISSLADLKGKRILSYTTTTAGYFLQRMLESAGLSIGDVTVVQTPLGEIGKVVANHEVDAIAIWEPDSEQALRALRAKGDDVLIFSGQGVYHERYNLCSTAAALADPARRQEIVRLMVAIMQACDAINGDAATAARAQQLVATSGGLYTAQEIALGWPNVRFVANYDDGLLDLFARQDPWLAAQEKRAPRTRAQLAPIIDKSAYEEARAIARPA
jgi:NitT/TauT family transport system substrate-binding protein